MNRTVFYISDGTGISAEALGHSLMTQFESLDFHSHTLPYIDNQEKAFQAVEAINKSFNLDGAKPIVFSTIVLPEIRNIISKANALVVDFFQAFINTLETELNLPARAAVGLSHAVIDEDRYNTRIDAVHFALSADDGLNSDEYKTADIILLGVSRTGKTPACLYLALQFGIRAANYPLTPEDLQAYKLPARLQAYKNRLFGLTIEAQRLHQIRSKRRPQSHYASLPQCQEELHLAEKLYLQEKIPYLNSTQLSVEELSTQILMLSGLRK